MMIKMISMIMIMIIMMIMMIMMILIPQLQLFACLSCHCCLCLHDQCIQVNFLSFLQKLFLWFLNMVSVILCDPSCKDGMMSDLQCYPFSDQVWIRYPCFWLFKLFLFFCSFYTKVSFSKEIALLTLHGE